MDKTENQESPASPARVEATADQIRELSKSYKTTKEESDAAQFQDNKLAFNRKQIPLRA